MKKATVPKLVCNISGASRPTTREYLDKKLAAINMTEAQYLEVYVNKDTLKALRAGKTVAEIRQTTESGRKMTAPISADDLKMMLKVNGKQKGGAAGPALPPREQRALEEAAKAAAAKTPAITVAPTPAPAAAKTNAPAKAAATASK